MSPTTLRLYLETSVIGYYTSRPSRDLVTAARQNVTRDWWEQVLPAYSAHISALVLRELSLGDPTAAEERTRVVSGMPVLQTTEEAETLSTRLVALGILPEQFAEDAVHIALAATHGMDFLVTWNFTHINNAVLKSRIEETCKDAGYSM